MKCCNVNSIAISKLVETKNNSKYLIEYLDIRSLVLILPKMNGYIKTFKVKDGDDVWYFSVKMMISY